MVDADGRQPGCLARSGQSASVRSSGTRTHATGQEPGHSGPGRPEPPRPENRRQARSQKGTTVEHDVSAAFVHESSSQPKYQSVNVTASPDSPDGGEAPVVPPEVVPDGSPPLAVDPSHCRRAHPRWQIGIAPSMTAGFQSLTSSTSSQASQGRSSSTGGVRARWWVGLPVPERLRYVPGVHVGGKACDRSPTRSPVSQAPKPKPSSCAEREEAVVRAGTAVADLGEE